MLPRFFIKILVLSFPTPSLYKFQDFSKKNRPQIVHGGVPVAMIRQFSCQNAAIFMSKNSKIWGIFVWYVEIVGNQIKNWGNVWSKEFALGGEQKLIGGKEF